jgi:hypothetical protein
MGFHNISEGRKVNYLSYCPLTLKILTSGKTYDGTSLMADDTILV